MSRTLCSGPCPVSLASRPVYRYIWRRCEGSWMYSTVCAELMQVPDVLLDVLMSPHGPCEASFFSKPLHQHLSP
ncbi:hypothetical protein ATANTOWER_019104 [Ataeniobius toweri]|uniref:Uncharacterized protein n=1 Tax=Ataeniobius toweri TaxID=208326 RepID=A0ABU7A235_9TELE|nr:hypothetical protein [Ataeniobius toweri]